VVLELSSFQLEDLTKSPHIAVWTNFTREHLAPADPNNPNYHKTLGDYFRAKLNIAAWQKSDDYLVVNDKFKILNLKTILKLKIQILKHLKSKTIYFKQSNLPSRLPGEHNKENIAAAEAVAKILKIPETTVARAVKNFVGLEHRIEPVGEVKGVKYYDDSFATTPESAIIALKSFVAPIILLAGGADKGADFKILAKEITKRVKFVVLFKGAATPRLKKNLLAAGYKPKQIKIVASMPEAVQTAAKQAEAGDIVLLSTACASFGLFKNYKQRGDLFKQAVKEL
jgi:UDP-N-acetylmuramoylalanine--D-glutamate ligase